MSAATIKDSCSALNQSLMELGALVCTPRNPQCPICPVKKMCVAFRENRMEQLPNLGERATATVRRFAAFIVENNGRFLVRQRAAGAVNAHLWEFPNAEVGARVSRAAGRSKVVRRRNLSTDIPQPDKLRPGEPRSESAVELATQLFGSHPTSILHLSTVKHSITRYRITLEAFAISVKRLPPKSAGLWKTPAQMRRLAFTAAHKKLASLVANRILSGR